MQKNKLNLHIYGIHLLNPYKTVVSHLKKHLTAVVLLDMSKAFDGIDHNLILVKLEDVGASPLALQWFHSYLTARSQVVRIGTASSEGLHLACGVPQGSILGPLLFSIYMICHQFHNIVQSSAT